MLTVHYLNIEYFLSRSYDFVAGLSLGDIPSWVAATAHGVVVAGMVLSLVLLVLVVYAQIRMVQTEHEGFHGMEEEEHEEVHRGPEGEMQEHTRWDDIVELASSGNESDWRRAILEADVMLSDALNEKGFTGPTVGDQLKQANPIQMTTLDVAWQAHKMRNQVAHQGEALVLTDRDVRATIDQYRRALQELGAI